ncbi:hypothetical protein [Paractinoplanes durhamensis]|uniref:hypothetical protein n=1 Tax=Paractinoplanes durhamensis TaxID=113563 RepID=UPI00363C2929
MTPSSRIGSAPSLVTVVRTWHAATPPAERKLTRLRSPVCSSRWSTCTPSRSAEVPATRMPAPMAVRTLRWDTCARPNPAARTSTMGCPEIAAGPSSGRSMTRPQSREVDLTMLLLFPIDQPTGAAIWIRSMFGA